MKPAALVTVCRGATLAAALDLVASFAAHHDGARIEVVVADAAPGLDDAGPGGARLVSGHDVAGEVFGVLATAYAAGRLEAALVPFALRRLGAPAVALAADAVVLGPIDLPDGEGPLLAASSGDEDAGVCDDGFLAL